MPSKLIENLGLYVHVPFCDRICHYCDFAKTARYDQTLTSAYWLYLKNQFVAWVQWWCSRYNEKPVISTVFFGGGTPSLFVSEVEEFLSILKNYTRLDSEITLEANPEHITHDSLKRWRAAGVNRLSLGIQSFEIQGLRFLTRKHSPIEATDAIVKGLEVFDNLNIDLIFGWPGQTEVSWKRDLESAVKLGVKHLSLYNLTYESGTVIGRRLKRGKISPATDDLEYRFYQVAQSYLADANYVQEEISNWSMKGYSCRHNWLYWSGLSYIALGVGAHGFVDLGDHPFGVRYKFPSSLRSVGPMRDIQCTGLLEDFLQSIGAIIDAKRGAKEFLLEMIGSQLRTARGIDLKFLQERTGFSFVPRPSIRQGFDEGWIMHDEPRARLVLSPSEWFREGYWALECALSFA